MTRRRRVFDLPLPEDDAPGAPDQTGVQPGTGAPDDGPARRSPMATAIAETAGSLRERAAAEAAIRAENDRLAADHVAMLRAGRVVELIPLERIDSTKLTRDRVSEGPAETDESFVELLRSIRETGLSNPIRVEATRDGRYELVQGLRRLSAYRALLAETGDAARWGRIPAGLMPPGLALKDLYRRMVDENLIRKDISFAEMAGLALAYAQDPRTAESNPDAVVSLLYGSAGYQKRSYIRAFVPLMTTLGQDLRHAPAIPRALGLALVQRMRDVPGIAAVIRNALAALDDSRSAEEELAILRRHAGASAAPPESAPAEPAPPESADPDLAPELAPELAPAPAATRPAPPPGSSVAPAPRDDAAALRRFRLDHPLGTATCTATGGRLEIRLAQDFPALDPARLEGAVRALLDRLAAGEDPA